MMTFKQGIQHIWREPKDAFYYWQGTLRLAILTGKGKWGWLARWFRVRSHIRQQYEWRKTRASSCYENGECRCCGCSTPDLFLAGKSCSIGKPKYPHCQTLNEGKPCYPAMMNRRAWQTFKRVNNLQ